MTAAAFWILVVFLTLCSLGGMYEFMIVRRCRFRVWLVTNTCSALSLLFLILWLLGARSLSYALAAMLGLYGLEGLLIFGWQYHPTIIIPQFMHATMIALNGILLCTIPGRGAIYGWLLGLAIGFVVRHYQRKALCRWSAIRVLFEDEVIGPIVQRLARSSCKESR